MSPIMSMLIMEVARLSGHFGLAHAVRDREALNKGRHEETVVDLGSRFREFLVDRGRRNDAAIGWSGGFLD